MRILKHSNFKRMGHTKSERVYKISDSLFHSTYILLKEYLEAMKPEVLRVNVDKKVRPIVLCGRDREKMTPLEKVQGDRDIIWVTLPPQTSETVPNK